LSKRPEAVDALPIDRNAHGQGYCAAREVFAPPSLMACLRVCQSWTVNVEQLALFHHQ
jgi:hypothetical protein